MKEPYRSIVDLPFDPHGWFLNATELGELLVGRKLNTVIEIGSWLGASTRFIASKMPENSVLYAIDTWRGSVEESTHTLDPRLPHLYQLFLSNVKHAGLTEKIVPIRMSSVEASKALNVKADLIYIDGAHDTQSVTEDILNWYPHLAPGGLICGDDWTWSTVRTAVINCSIILNKKGFYKKNLWWYE